MTGTKKKCKFRGKWYSAPLTEYIVLVQNNNKPQTLVDGELLFSRW